jgi:oligopeptide transport system ATP-binding protein
MTAESTAPAGETVLEVKGLRKRFPLKSPVLRRTVGHVEALRGVDLRVEPGQTVALVGESGSGKSTLARCALGLEEIDGGTVSVGADGQTIDRLGRRELARRVQVVFQDPATSLSPRMRIGQIMNEPFVVHRGEASAEEARLRVEEALESVGIPVAWSQRLPHQLSGGQRQRVAIARALVLRPQVIILDEPVSALDVSIQAQILVLLRALQAELRIAYLLISHDLGVVRALSDYVYVMYLGEIVEHGRPDDILRNPRHPYTAALIKADPSHPSWDPEALTGA